MPTEMGSPIYAGYRPAADAAAVAILREAGAVILGKTVTAEFAGITSVEQAERLVGADLLIDEADRRALESGEYWPDQLIGLEVRVGSSTVGVVNDLIEAPQDRLLVTCHDGSEAEIPFVEPLVPEVDVTGGWLRLDPPEGLLGSW